MKTTTLKKITLSTFFLLIVGCGGGSGGSGESKTTTSNTSNSNEERAETQALTVLSVSPSDQEKDVALDINISILFDKNILASSLNKSRTTLNNKSSLTLNTKSSITLKKNANILVGGSVSFNAPNTAIFSPNKKLALLSDYVITVDTTVSDLAGNTLANEEKYNFTTRDGVWQEAKFLDINNTGDGREPQIAFDDVGNAIAVWRQFDGTRYNIWANRFTSTTGWGNTEKIEDDEGNASSPQISMDTAGNAIAVWSQVDGTIRNILANRFSLIGGWEGAEKIEDDIGQANESPKVSMDSAGNAIAVWSQSDGTGRHSIWANRFSLISGWESAEKIEKDDTGSARYPQVSMDSAGNAIAVWEQSDGVRHNIWANRFSFRAGGWSSADTIEKNSGFAYSPQVSMDSKGNAIAVWSQSDGTIRNIWANRFTPANAWGSAEEIESDDSGNANFPEVSMDSKGNAIALWSKFDGIKNNIWVNRFTLRGRWGNAEEIENGSGIADSSKISMDSAGNAIAVWRQYDITGSYDILANRFTPTTGWGSAEKIEDDEEDAASPQIAFDDLGNAIAIWIHSDGTRDNIMVNHFK